MPTASELYDRREYARERGLLVLYLFACIEGTVISGVDLYTLEVIDDQGRRYDPCSTIEEAVNLLILLARR